MYTNWLSIPDSHDYSYYNLPYGIFSTSKKAATVGVAIGDFVIDVYALVKQCDQHQFDFDIELFNTNRLNGFIALEKKQWSAFRVFLQEQLKNENSELSKNRDQLLIPMGEVRMHMPVKVGDYTDFYSSEEHATNIGTMFRGKDNALMPNWKHLPVAYHGRASSICVSGTDVFRPMGQTIPPNADKPVFGPSKRVDFELEMAFITSNGKELGERISVEEADDYIFGFVLFNDWSARDIQKWEYVPLGPFLAKNFASVISPWVVTKEALDFVRTEGPKQDVEVLPYLKSEGANNYDIELFVDIETEQSSTTVCHSNFKYMYWNVAQQLAHHTVNGCNIKAGDMMASGTISGKDKSAFGSMLELSWSGKEEIKLKDGSSRFFIEDNDTVVLRGFAEKDGIRVGFGEARSKVLPAKAFK